MTHALVMAVFQGGSNLPEDRFVNTFHFNSPEPFAGGAGLATLAIGAVESFYVEPHTPFPALGSLMASYVNRPFKVQAYDMSTASPRVPVIGTATLPTADSGSSHIPEEAAVCLSLHGVPPVTPTSRGRIFFGPLQDVCLANAGPGAPVRVQPTVVYALTAAANALTDVGIGWSVYSKKLGTFTPITGGWVDNAADTQRRRGPDASGRTTWSID